MGRPIYFYVAGFFFLILNLLLLSSAYSARPDDITSPNPITTASPDDIPSPNPITTASPDDIPSPNPITTASPDDTPSPDPIITASPVLNLTDTSRESIAQLTESSVEKEKSTTTLETIVKKNFFQTNYADISFEHEETLSDFLWRISGRQFTLASDVELAQSRVDRIIDRVQSVLDMYPNDFHIKIELHPKHKKGDIASYSHIA